MKVLRMIFCILACVCVAAVVPIGIFFEWYCIVPLGGAVLFGVLTVAAKNNFRREKPAPKTDFMNSEEENERIRNGESEK